MSDGLRYAPPGLDYDPRAMDELLRREGTFSSGVESPVVDRRGPYQGYARMLTAEGGVLIHYLDLNLTLPYKVLRAITLCSITVLSLWLIFYILPLSDTGFFISLAVLASIDCLIYFYKIKTRHSVEIRPDAMIVDGTDVFFAEDIGDNWPELMMKDNNPDRMVIQAIVGTRLIELLTVNRVDKWDRTGEILEADLKIAMEQLWGRQEVTFPAAS